MLLALFHNTARDTALGLVTFHYKSNRIILSGKLAVRKCKSLSNMAQNASNLSQNDFKMMFSGEILSAAKAMVLKIPC